MVFAMSFPKRLVTLRKARGLTQQELATKAGVKVLQIRRYEGGSAQPSLEVIRKLAVALRVSSDALLFDEHERGPDEDLRMQFEAISRFSAEEKRVIKSVLEGLILKHEAKRWSSSP
jgi:transcriptional regulator with XRE-family HTH domain